MRFDYLSVLLAVVVATPIFADITDYIADIPACGLACLLEVIPKSECALTNQTCICTSEEVTKAVTLCVSQNCTVIESLKLANISEVSCGRTSESKQTYIMSTVAFEGIVLIAGGLRLYSRWKFEGELKLDDYLIVAALILSIPFACMGVLVAAYGFGLNIWEIPPHDLTMALKIFFIDELLYICILGCAKISILVFYLRIFPSKTFRRLCFTVIVWSILFTSFFFLLTLFQCLPISYNWDGWRGEMAGRCLNLSAQTYASASINIALDFTVLLLPVPWLCKLQVILKTKFHLLLMFSVGLFICITSVVRFTKLVQFKATTNPTMDYVDTTYWTAIEVYVSVIVPCLPAIRSLLSHKFPGLFGLDSQVNSRKTYERSHATGNSFVMSSRKPNAPTEYDDHGKFLKDLTLGDKIKGMVSTNVGTGSRTSEEGLVNQQGISVSTETKIHNNV